MMEMLKQMNPLARKSILRGTCRSPLTNLQGNAANILMQLNVGELACQASIDGYDLVLMAANKGPPLPQGMDMATYCSHVQPICLLFSREISPFPHTH